MSWDALPEWIQYVTRGLLIFSLMSCSAVILSRAGRSPYWAVFTIVPYVIIAAIWLFAFTKWPKVDARS